MSSDTATREVASSGSAASHRTDRLRLHLLAGAMVLSPLLMAVGFLVLPDDVPDSERGRELVAYAAEHGGAMYGGTILFALGLVLLVALALGTALLTRSRGAVLGTIGALLLCIGGIAFGAAMTLVASVTYVMGASGLDQEVLGRLQDFASDNATIGSVFPIGFFGLVVGSVLCALALWRSRQVAVWQALLVALLPVGIGLGFEAGLLGPVVLLGVLVGVAAVARRLVSVRPA